MEDTRSETKTQQASYGAMMDYDVIVFVVTAVTEWVEGTYQVRQPILDWIGSLGIRGPEERPFLVLAGSPDMWRNGVPATREGMDDVRSAAGFDLGVFKEGAVFMWPAPHLVRVAMGHYGVWNPERVLVVGNHDLHCRAADLVGAAYLPVEKFTGVL